MNRQTKSFITTTIIVILLCLISKLFDNPKDAYDTMLLGAILYSVILSNNQRDNE